MFTSRSLASGSLHLEQQIDQIQATLAAMAEVKVRAAERERKKDRRQWLAGEAAGLRAARDFIREAIGHAIR